MTIAEVDLEVLRQVGFTDGEIKVYFALLETGSTTSGPISEKSGVSRSKIYGILDRLIQKGIVSFIVREKTRYYQAAEPEQLRAYLDRREEEFGRQRKRMDDLIRSMGQLTKESKKSEAQLFFGFKGVQTVHEHTYSRLKRGDEFFYIGGPAEQPSHYHAYWQRDHLRRAKAGIRVKLLMHYDTSDDVLMNRNGYQGCEARRMPFRIDTPAWFMGYLDVAVISYPSENPIAIEIRNPQIAQSIRAYFEALWAQSRPFKRS